MCCSKKFVITNSRYFMRPGKISKVLVVQEQVVKAGQVLIVMEAMKMEYTLKSEVDGQVASISAQVGEQVPLGKVLLHIQEKK